MYKNEKMVGSGEQTLVLSHGYGCSQAIWDEVVPYLSKSNQVLLFDWDFTGSAEGVAAKEHSFNAFADDLIALMEKMKVTNAIYVGHSMAAMFGCIASVRRPDLFSHLVLLCASPRYLNSEDFEGGFEREAIENMLANISSNFHSWAEGFVPSVVGVDDPASIEKVRKSFLAMDPDIALALARMIFLGDQRDVLDNVEVPCTIIQAANDFAVPVCVGRYMQGKIKGKATLVTIESEGHLPQLLARHKLLDILDNVLLS